MQHQSALSRVTTDVWVEIFRMISDIPHLARVARVCKYFQRTVDDPKHACFGAFQSITICFPYFKDLDRAANFRLILLPLPKTVASMTERDFLFPQQSKTAIVVCPEETLGIHSVTGLNKALHRFIRYKFRPDFEGPAIDNGLWSKDPAFWDVMAHAHRLNLFDAGGAPSLALNRIFQARSLTTSAQVLAQIGVESFPFLEDVELDVEEVEVLNDILPSLRDKIVRLTSTMDVAQVFEDDMNSWTRLKAMNLNVEAPPVRPLLCFPPLADLTLDFNGSNLEFANTSFLNNVKKLEQTLESLTVLHLEIDGLEPDLLNLLRCFSRCVKLTTLNVSCSVPRHSDRGQDTSTFSLFKTAVVADVLEAIAPNPDDFNGLAENVQTIRICIEVVVFPPEDRFCLSDENSEQIRLQILNKLSTWTHFQDRDLSVACVMKTSE